LSYFATGGGSASALTVALAHGLSVALALAFALALVLAFLSVIPALSEAEGEEPASPTTNPVISTEARSA
jgi:hypothetical protein